MIIRKEEPRDYLQVFELVKAAFATTSYSDGSEAPRVNQNRNLPHFLPELSLVAEENGKIVGYICLHTMQIRYKDRTDIQVEVAPLAVLPAHFGRGIGGALLREAHNRAEKMGFSAVFLLGNPGYYPRFGYEPTYRYQIYHERYPGQQLEACMVKLLKAGYLQQEEGYTDIE